MNQRLLAVLAILGCVTVSVAGPAAALNASSGMPREPRTIRGICARLSGGNHIPYRGWHTRNHLGFVSCLRDSQVAGSPRLTAGR
jgi:hypothetical protein